MDNRRFVLDVVGFMMVALVFCAGPALGQTGTLFVQDDMVGIGVETPEAPLHIVDSSGSCRLLMQEQSSTPLTRTMLRLENKGGILMRFRDTTTGKIWNMTLQDFGVTWSLQNSGGAEFLITNSGAVLMGPGASTTFDLDPAGNLEITGTLTESSSATAKTDFRGLDAAAVLQEIRKLSVSEWSYKHDDPSVRHVGPTAEDFHAAFGLGTGGSGISPRNLSGVALIAIQALADQLEQRQLQIHDLEAENALLESSRVELERRIERLERAIGLTHDATSND
jgi:hypothetical protein